MKNYDAIAQNFGSIHRRADESVARNGKRVADYIDLPDETEIIRFEDLNDLANVAGAFDDTCFVSLTGEARALLANKQLRLTIRSMNVAKQAISHAAIHLTRQTGTVQVLFGSSGTIIFGALGAVTVDIRIGHNGLVVIGDKTTINGARLVAVKSNILVGRDGLWSDEILAQGFDQHGIFDLNSREFINLDRHDIVIGEHVWVGRRATLMPGTEIGPGAIVGAGSMVTRTVPRFSVVAGNPARVVREDVSWSRPWTHLDLDTVDFLQRNSP